MKYFISLCMVFSFSFASVDINTADASSLSTLKGIGTKKAEAIVTYRDSHGCFKNVDALQAVKGIGEKIISGNKSELTASSCDK